MNHWKQTDLNINIGIASNQFIMDFYEKITLSTAKRTVEAIWTLDLLPVTFIGYTYMVFPN